MRTTVSKILLSSSDKEHDELLRECCRYVMERGGSFSIETRYEDNWVRIFTINWPEVDQA